MKKEKTLHLGVVPESQGATLATRSTTASKRHLRALSHSPSDPELNFFSVSSSL